MQFEKTGALRKTPVYTLHQNIRSVGIGTNQFRT